MTGSHEPVFLCYRKLQQCKSFKENAKHFLRSAAAGRHFFGTNVYIFCMNDVKNCI